ncbi:uncharacterized protein [Antedon mediterranea]|uniref:uncharacterized protein isoform X2 n=1 Tax=Antedon mediterranea TaxID=105859 RepID=UPI003AF9CA47
MKCQVKLFMKCQVKLVMKCQVNKMAKSECVSEPCKEVESLFDVATVTNTGKDTYAEETYLSLQHNHNYYIVVFGNDEAGQCNKTSRSFKVDMTKPIEGRIWLENNPHVPGDFPAWFTADSTSLTIHWSEFNDPESQIGYYEIELLVAPSCKAGDDEVLTTVVEKVKLEAHISTYSFYGLSLKSLTPYFVKLTTTNKASSYITTTSSPIFFDDSSPTAGLVVDGLDFRKDMPHISYVDHMSGSFIFLPNPNIEPCPDQHATFDDESWQSVNSKGIWNMDGKDWKIHYDHEQITVTDPNNIVLTMEPDIQEPYVLAGAVSRRVEIGEGGTFKMDLKAATQDIPVITSVVFWDGPDGVVGDLMVPTEELEPCSCCYEENNGTGCDCDCSAVGATTSQRITTILPPTTTVPWEIIEDGEDVESGEESKKQTAVQQACGLQLYADKEIPSATLWCRFHQDKVDYLYSIFDLTFDPSSDWHHYEFTFKEEYDPDPAKIGYTIQLSVDGNLLGDLSGAPRLSNNTKLTLQLWNDNNYVPEFTDPFNIPKTSAYFANIRLPPPSEDLCRYGSSFIGGLAPAVKFLAGIGTEKDTTDFQKDIEVFLPCYPCYSECDRYFCDPLCKASDMQLVQFTIDNLKLDEMRWYSDTNGTDEYLPATYYLRVEEILANGVTTNSSSDGISVDTSPPEFDYMSYYDVSLDENQPIAAQSSNSTIKASWEFLDQESLVVGYYWAIGTSPGGTDVQPFVYLGNVKEGRNDDLEGVLENRAYYYVTVRAVNGAGLMKLEEFEGVLVVFDYPTVEDVEETVFYVQTVDDLNDDKYVSFEQSRLGLSWTTAHDPSVAEYRYCVGSSPDKADDIIPCITVSNDGGGTVEIYDGKVYINDVEYSDVSDFRTPDENGTMPGNNKLLLEPGKCVFTTLSICNEAHTCVNKTVNTTNILGPDDIIISSDDGNGISFSWGKDVSTMNSDLNSDPPVDTFSIDISSIGGVDPGYSMSFGILSNDDINKEYTSEATAEYVPYIVNPLYTMDRVERHLRSRVKAVYEPSFYMSPLGQTEMNGPFQIIVKFNKTSDWTDQYPSLVYWNKDDGQWKDAGLTCPDELPQFDEEKGEITVMVCGTSLTETETGTRRRRDTDSYNPQSYFSKETLFTVAVVDKNAVNDPPVIIMQDVLKIHEDAGILEYQIHVSDSDDDPVVLELDSKYPITELGEIVELSSDGFFKFKPCLDCYGQAVIFIKAVETPESPFIEPLSSTKSFEIDISSEHDPPIVYFCTKKTANSPAVNQRFYQVTMEENTDTNIAYSDLIGYVGAYDVDSDDLLNLMFQTPPQGQFHIKPPGRGVPPADEDLCQIQYPHAESLMTWVWTEVTYKPNPDFYGSDSLSVFALDKDGLYSKVLEIDIAVMRNPCSVHGICQGVFNDTKCEDPKRKNGFDGYNCSCEFGWQGEYCESDRDECQLDDPCASPYICTNEPGGFRCACPPGKSNCDMEAWVISLISLAVGAIIFGSLAGIAYWYKRKNSKIDFDESDEDHINVLPMDNESQVQLETFDGSNAIEETVNGETSLQSNIVCVPIEGTSDTKNTGDNTQKRNVTKPKRNQVSPQPPKIENEDEGKRSPTDEFKRPMSSPRNQFLASTDVDDDAISLSSLGDVKEGHNLSHSLDGRVSQNELKVAFAPTKRLPKKQARVVGIDKVYDDVEEFVDDGELQSSGAVEKPHMASEELERTTLVDSLIAETEPVNHQVAPEDLQKTTPADSIIVMTQDPSEMSEEAPEDLQRATPFLPGVIDDGLMSEDVV